MFMEIRLSSAHTIMARHGVEDILQNFRGLLLSGVDVDASEIEIVTGFFELVIEVALFEY